MNELLKLTLEAHGGMDRWKNFQTISARLKVGGITWALKQVPGIMDDIRVTTSTKREFASFYPFIKPDWHNSFEPERVAILDSQDQVIEELIDPRPTFAGYRTETPWSHLQLTYFTGYAMWTYFNAPFNFANPGYQANELEPWEENNEIFRRLQVTFPKGVATHGPVQTFYIDREGLIRRHDYNVEILNEAASVHYITDYVEVQGIKFGTKRSVYKRLEDNSALVPEPLFITIDISEIELK